MNNNNKEFQNNRLSIYDDDMDYKNMNDDSNDDMGDEIDEFDFDDDEDDEDDNDDIDEYIDDDIKEVGNNNNFDLIYRLNTNKHKQEGKHQLKNDTIFKGKKNDNSNDQESYVNDDYYNDTLKVDIEYDAYAEDYLNQNNLTKDIYNVLNEQTNLDFTQNRRKPNKETFNNYYNLLLDRLGFRYTKSEIFVELSYYFTDNIFNMFKLLDKKPATIIIKELIQKGYLKNINNIDFL